ncbi:hypothetical protein [Streptomyces sp. NBC_01602]|uniref:hypothetical protein n=1 Tax=Streptomyces sp. NBC_01602 TaxID=2975893 RepID=UPI00386EA54D|nr:hypothetical protein OG955_05810 [Streptomyces sp. NBC_01602]
MDTKAASQVIARATGTGYAGTYVRFDGYHSHHLPLLLAAHQHGFTGDTDALAAYLIDEVPEGWSFTGTDLLDGAPDALRRHLAAAHDESGRPYPAHPTWPPLIYTERTASQLAGVMPSTRRVVSAYLPCPFACAGSPSAE